MRQRAMKRGREARSRFEMNSDKENDEKERKEKGAKS